MIISCFHRHNVYGQNKSAVGPTIDSAASMERERLFFISLWCTGRKLKVFDDHAVFDAKF